MENVIDLKMALVEHFTYPSEEQVLIYDGSELANDQMIAELRLRGNQLHLDLASWTHGRPGRTQL